MRISLGTKIFALLLAIVVVLLGGALTAIDRAYRDKVEHDLIPARIAQGRASFVSSTEALTRELTRDGLHLAQSARLWSCLEEKRLYPEAGPAALYELKYNNVDCDFLAITQRSGRPVSRYLSGATTGPADASPLVARPVVAGQAYPEDRLIQQVVAGSEPADTVTFLVDEGRLFQAIAFPMYRGDRLLGVLVLGKQIDDAAAGVIHRQQDAADDTAFVVGRTIVASSLGRERRAEAQAALAALITPDALPVVADRTVAGRRCRIVLAPIHRSGAPVPLFTALFLSLDGLLSFRDRMHRLTLGVALLAALLCIVLAALVSRHVAAPVRALVAGTQRVALGDYAHRIPPTTSDELGDLAQAFNTMAGDLQSRERVRAVLNKVVARDVAEELLSGDLGLGGRMMHTTLIFADLRGFTAMSRDMSPHAVVEMLNEYLTLMTREILGAKGIVDKYVGDEIIGVFGAPRTSGADARTALEVALRMQARLSELNERRKLRGDPPLAMGVGVNTGDVVAGCMGSEELLSYTCIGEAVNFTSRLCSNAKAGQVLVSEKTLLEAGPAARARALEPITVKGYAHPVPVFELVSVEDAAAEATSR